ncbi:MAG: APC family permease [Vulcanimicrobiota bacterium]
MTEDKRRLGPLDATAVIVGIIIGSGIFLVPADIARQVKSPSLILGVWLVGGLLSLLGGLVYAELGSRRPEAGGQYVYLRDAYGPACGFMFSWVLFLVIQTGSIAAVAVAFIQYLGYFVPIHGPWIKLLAVLTILALSHLNAVSLRSGVTVQNLFCGLKLLALFGLIAGGLATGHADPSHLRGVAPTANLSTLSAVGLALIGVLWSFDGWNCLSFVSGEVKDPNRSLPLALVGGITVVTIVYGLANLTYLMVLGAEGMANAPDGRVASEAARLFAGPTGAACIAAGITVSTFGCLNGMIMAAPWVYFAVARDGLFFASFGRFNEETQTPSTAIYAQAVWASLLALSGSYDQLFTYVIFVSWIFYVLAITAVYIFRHREGPPAEGQYRTWGYPLTPALFLLAAFGMLINTVYTQPGPALAGLFITALGLPVYARFRRR